jgi:prepilin-type N-terminal cleavage/methylation domain-containing protein
LIRRLIKNEAGYSLVEVMVAIMLLAIAIIPMVGMFDMGLKAATQGSDYDKARALANQKLEEIRALPYKSPDPLSAGTANSVVEKYAPPGPASATEGIFTYTVQTKFVDANLANPSDSPATPQMRVQVTVNWEGNKSYTTTGYVAGG